MYELYVFFGNLEIWRWWWDFEIWDSSNHLTLELFWVVPVEVNKTLTLIGERAPSCGADLMSARAGLKHYLGRACTSEHGGGGVSSSKSRKSKKWSTIKPVAERLLSTCLSGWYHHPTIMAQADRWTCQEIVKSHFPSEAEISKAMLKMHPHLRKTAKYVWAACYNMLYTKFLESKGVTAANFHKFGLIFGCRRQQPGAKTVFSAFVQAEKLDQTRPVPLNSDEPCY